MANIICPIDIIWISQMLSYNQLSLETLPANTVTITENPFNFFLSWQEKKFLDINKNVADER